MDEGQRFSDLKMRTICARFMTEFGYQRKEVVRIG